jgi:YD repeat-containing protein
LNGEFTEYQYDEFGRIIRTRMPSGGVMRRAYESWGDARGQRIVDTVEDGSVEGLWSRQYLDGLGRVYSVERRSELPNELLAQRIFYSDASNRPYRISRSSRWRFGGLWRSRAYTTYHYDVAGRVMRVVNPDDTATIFRIEPSANRLITTVIDEKGESSQSVSDAFGRLVEARGFDTNATMTTSYAYDGANQLTTVTDPNGNPTRYTWDMLGRNRTVIDPNLVSAHIPSIWWATSRRIPTHATALSRLTTMN